MKSIPLRIALVASSCCLAACSSSDLTRRHSVDLTWLTGSGSKESLDSDKEPVVKGTVFVAGDPTPTAATTQRPGILELTEQGQKAALEKLAIDSVPIQNLFSRPLTQTRPPEDSRTQLERRLVFSSSLNPRNKWIGVGDRIEHLEFTAELVTDDCTPSPVEFTSWNRFETQREALSFATLGLTRSSMTNASLAPTLTGAITGVAEIGRSSSRETTEQATVGRRFDTLTPLLTNYTATLIQRGDVGLEIPGLITADIAFRFKNPQSVEFFSFNELFDTKGNPVAPADAVFSRSRRDIPGMGDAVQLKVNAEAIVRDVVLGTGRHRVEKKHWVKMRDADVYFAGNTSVDFVELVTKSEREALRERWRINLVGSSDLSVNPLEISVDKAAPALPQPGFITADSDSVPAPTPLPVLFERREDAVRFGQWLAQVSHKDGSGGGDADVVRVAQGKFRASDGKGDLFYLSGASSGATPGLYLRRSENDDPGKWVKVTPVASKAP